MATDYSTFTQAGAVGLALAMILVFGLFGRTILRMMELHIAHLNTETDRHTGLLQRLADSNELQADLLRGIEGTLTTTAVAAQSAASAAQSAAGAAAAGAAAAAAQATLLTARLAPHGEEVT